MRLVLKSTLVVFAVYLLLVGAVAWWMAAQLQTLASGMAESTAHLVGGEVARALADSAVDELRRADDTTGARLKQIVDDVTQHSGLLTSLAVVDRNGIVVAGDNVEVGRQLAIPAVIFGSDNGVRTITETGPFGDGSFYMLVPLKAGTELAGYLRLEMRSERIAHIYERATRNLVLVALGGLVAVGLVGLVLHVQISRRSEQVARALEGAVRGDAVAPEQAAQADEFSRAFAVARKVGRELTEARGERLQAQQRMDALIRALDVGVLVLEPDQQLGFANARAVELLGGPGVGDLRQRWEEEIRPRLAALPNRLAAGRRQIELPANDAGPRLVLEFYALGDPQRSEGALVLVKNAESLEALESELGLAIQMRGLTRFYAAFVHDLKAPLNAMVMTLELLSIAVHRADDDDAARAKQLKYVGVLNEEIRRLDRQLRTLLSHATAPSQGRGAVDLCALLQELEALLAPQAKRQRVALNVQVPAAGVVLVGDADRLKQALLNILINALEAMPDGGELAITLQQLDGAAHITLHDSGPGIPPDLLASIYEMHFTTKSGGTGVGLYVARAVVQAHGGNIDVDSEPGRGTTFTLMLPLEEAPPAVT